MTAEKHANHTSTLSTELVPITFYDTVLRNCK